LAPTACSELLPGRVQSEHLLCYLGVKGSNRPPPGSAAQAGCSHTGKLEE